MSKQDTIISLLKEINESVDDLDTTFVTTDLAITENGLYKPIDYNVEGFNTVDVHVSPTLEEITITENGEYIPSDGVDGFSKVVVEAGTSNKVVLSSIKLYNSDIIDGYWAAELVDTRNIKTFASQFSGFSSLQYLDVSNWDTSNVTSMASMFASCTSLQYLDLSRWDTSKLKDMVGMFSNCENLEQLNMNNNWNVSACTNLNGTFHNCKKLQHLDVSNWDTSNNKGWSMTFASCTSLQYLDVSNWNVSKASTMNEMFDSCTSLQYLDVSNWNVSNVTNARNMFYWCRSLTSIIGKRTIEDVLVNNICALNGLKCSTSFGGCDNLDRASLRALINGLADLTGQTAQTLSLGTTLIAKLTEEDIAIATAKNWTIS